MKSSRIRNKLALLKAHLPFPLKRNALLSLLAASLLFSVFTSYSLPRAGAQARKPFDLVSDSQDVNGFEFNPRWAWQDTNGGAPDPNELCFNNDGKFGDCTTDPVYFDEPDPIKVLRQTCRIGAGTSVKGHINWRAVTYEGRISWSNFSIDGDYCFEVAPPNNNGLTANRPTLHVEFHAGETIKHFNTSWWKEFRKSVGIRNIAFGKTKKERDFVKEFVDGKRVRVIGLLNLDCVHKCYTELHPVYAIAINIKTELPDKDGFVEEIWAIFARNWGNEGWCSQNQHYLNLETTSNRLALTLPWGPDMPKGDTALSFDVVDDGTKFLSNSPQATGPQISIAGNQGIMLSFLLPKAEDRPRVHGELRLRWKMPKTTAVPTPSSAMGPSSTESGDEEIEEKSLFEALGEEGRKRAESESGAEKPDTIPQRVTVKSDVGANKVFSILDRLTRIQRVIIQPAPPVQSPRVEPKFDAEKAEKDMRLLGTSASRP